MGSGLIYVPGKGDGSFGSPVLFSQQNSSVIQGVLVADLNNDKKLDLVWNGAVYLGNGDGTFQQAPLGISGTPLAIADLNGDGIPDLLMGGAPGISGGIYAGNGNGTFQPTPFYTNPSLRGASASIGDVNADGHPDIVVQSNTSENINVVQVLFGDGTGNFVLDSNTYNSSFFIDGSIGGVLARLNNQAPKLPNDNALDYLSFSSGAVIPLLNQTNPKPVAPTLAGSSTVLSASANTSGENQQLTFTATVTGFTPTGEVTFTSGATTLGTATLVNGTATLSASFAAAGTYSVIASYAGDAENQPSTSNAVSIVVAIPDFSVAISPATATITAGQSVAAALTITPVGGYTGTVSFSCGTLPSSATCTFAPSSVTAGNGTAASTKLTITTTPPSAATQRAAVRKLATVAWASVAFLFLLPGRGSKRYRRRMYFVPIVLLTCSLISLSGCGGSKASSGGSDTSGAASSPGTPAGTQTITVTATDSTGKLSHAVTLQVVVQ
jgi:hypothetical protein